MPVVSLALTQVTVDGDTQPRAAIHDDTVTDYAEALAAGKKFPPLVVFHDGERHWLADGFHRFHAAQKAQLKTLPCDVREGSIEDARWYAVGANCTHGLRRTNADKRRAVMLALRLHPEHSDPKIAQHVGVSAEMVRQVRPEVPTVGACDARTGRDGKSYPVPPPPPIPPVPPAAAVPGSLPPMPPALDAGPRPAVPPSPAAPPATGEAPARPIPPVPPAPGVPSAPAGMVDGIGRAIPPHLQDLWNRRHELLDMMHAIGKMRGALQRASEEKDPLFGEVHCLIVVGDLRMVYGKLSVCVPFAVCSNCHGLKGVMEGCRFCGGHGLISEYRWKSLVPENTRKLILSQIAKP